MSGKEGGGGVGREQVRQRRERRRCRSGKSGNNGPSRYTGVPGVRWCDGEGLHEGEGRGQQQEQEGGEAHGWGVLGLARVVV